MVKIISFFRITTMKVIPRVRKAFFEQLRKPNFPIFCVFRKSEEDRSGYSRQDPMNWQQGYDEKKNKEPDDRKSGSGYDRRREDDRSHGSRKSVDDEDSLGQYSHQKKSDDELQRRHSSDMEMDDGEDELDNYVNNVVSEGAF